MISGALVALGWLTLIAGLISALTLLVRIYLADSYPQAFVLVVFIMVLGVGVISEALHLLDALHVESIRSFWAGLLVITAGWALWVRKQIRPAQLRLSLSQKLLYGAVGTLFGSTLITGVLVAPNNWDSLTYHLTRAAHWLQNGNLDFFGTSNARQNVITPLPDLVLAHLMALDEFAYLVTLGQWLSGVAIVVAMGLVSRMVVHSRVTPANHIVTNDFVAATVVLAGTVPMLLSQMSTTQVDLIAGVPLAAVVVALGWAINERLTAGAALLGLGVAASVALKATSMILLAPLAVVVAYILFRKGGVWPIVVATLTSFVGSLVLVSRHVWVSLSAGDYAAASARSVINETVSLEVVVVNLGRNIASGLQSPFTGINTQIQNLTQTGLAQFGLDVSLPAATYGGSTFNLGAAWSEDHVSAIFQLLLLTVALTTFLVSRAWRTHPRLVWVISVVASQLVLMSAMLRWQPWINRFTFLIVVAATPLMAWLLLRFKPWLRTTVLAFFLIFGLTWVVFQPLRGLVGTSWLPQQVLDQASIPSYDNPLAYDRFEQHFMHHPSTARTYRDALEYALSLSPDQIQLQIGGDSWEYPIWYALANEPRQIRLSHKALGVKQAHGLVEKTGGGLDEHVTVLLCVGSCDLSDPEFKVEFDPQTLKRFTTVGPATRSVDIGPEITVGRRLP